MKTSILSLALGIMLASHVAAYAGQSPNVINAIEDLSPDRIIANELLMRQPSRNGVTRSNPAEPTG
jgi:hypothetical protein